jgi:hypothetical protein
MRAILVSVDFADLLAITLPYNRHHFTEVMVVTTPRDKETIKTANREGCDVCMTEAFYDNGAHFNKWKGLELGLSRFGREGLLCIMDADILWPRELLHHHFEDGYLYTPPRRLLIDVTQEIPPEGQWQNYPIMNEMEWAGYTQIFYGHDPVLPKPPWHQQDWTHAGGADSFFQELWGRGRKLRPGFTVLHLGPPFTNWCGRASQRVDGSLPAHGSEHRAALHQFMQQRLSADPQDRYRAERLSRSIWEIMGLQPSDPVKKEDER